MSYRIAPLGGARVFAGWLVPEFSGRAAGLQQGGARVFPERGSFPGRTPLAVVPESSNSAGVVPEFSPRARWGSARVFPVEEVNLEGVQDG